MRKIAHLFVYVILIAGVSACYQDDINNLQSQIDELKNTQIASIGSQISNIQASISMLEKLDAGLKSYVEELTQKEQGVEESLIQKEAALSKRIDELKIYVNQELKNQTDWVNASFSTLAQYQSTCNEIAFIKQDLSDLESNLKSLVSDAEISIKSWVNEQLTGYYTIAEMDAKISALEKSIIDGDDAQASELDALKTELEAARADINSAYEKAISEAISTCAGMINERIAAEIKTATEALQGQVDAILSRLDSIESRLNTLESSVASLINMIQSIVVVPDYCDGSVKMSKSAKNYVRFEVYPLDAAAAIAQKGVSIIHLDYVETLTKNSEVFVNLPITSVSFTGKTLLLAVDGRGLPEALVEWNSSACARLMVSDGTNFQSSDYFPLYITSADNSDENAVIEYPIVSVGHPAISCMVKKAHQIADIQWTPLRQVPTLTDSWLPAGTTIYGIPYSSVKEKDKFVGQEVSFYTFMSAVKNPRSVIYTEDVKAPPYNGVNCGPYYGTVCSMAVNYALGIERPIESKMYSSHPLFAKVKYQDIYDIYPGDVLLSKGHVVLLLDVQRNDLGDPMFFSILESSGYTRIKHYSISDFTRRWDEDGWVAFRYLKLGDNTNYTPLPFVHLEGDPESTPKYNEELCTSRGDCVCYREGEDVVVNVLSSKYKTMSVYRNETAYQTIVIDSEDITLSDLPYGHYRVRLENDNKVSKEISFEVIDTCVSVYKGKEVHFSSLNAVPEYYVICDIKGSRELIRDLLEQEKEIGSFTLDDDYTGFYLKVFFKGEYGRVSNDPIKL